jgi:hypothetical protein
MQAASAPGDAEAAWLKVKIARKLRVQIFQLESPSGHCSSKASRSRVR